MEPVVPSSDYNAEFAQGGVKAAIAATGAKENSLLMVPVEKLVVPAGLNVRIHDDDYEARIDEVCESIINNGFFKHMPLPGYAAQEGTGADKQTFIYITGGFTRLAAAKRAIERGTPLEAIPVVLKPAGTSMLDLTLAVAIDNTGAPLKPYEKGILIKRAIGYGGEIPDIARKLNVTEQYVNDLLYLHGLPNATQQMVINGQVSAGHAMKMSRQHGPAEALKALQAALAAGDATGDAGDTGTGSAPSTPPARVTPRQTRSPAAGRANGSGSLTISVKEQLAVAMAAINYCITLPGDGIEFLTRWRDEDADARAEVMATLQPAAKPKTKKQLADERRAEKAAAKAKKEKDKADKKAERERKAKERADNAAAKAAAAAAAAAPKDTSDIDL